MDVLSAETGAFEIMSITTFSRAAAEKTLQIKLLSLSYGISAKVMIETSSVMVIVVMFVPSFLYESASRSDMSYSPFSFPERNTAAFMDPFAKTSLLAAECDSVITSSCPAKIISCSPTIVPPRME